MKPYHIIAEEDENGYHVIIPEKPEFSAHVNHVSDIGSRKRNVGNSEEGR